MSDNGWIWSLNRCLVGETALDGGGVITELLEELDRLSWNDRDVFGIHLALEEALVNAVKHGNHQDPEKCVEVDCRVSRDRVRIQIKDEGAGFDPGSVPDPTDDEHLEIPSGRGLMLMRCYMTSVHYNARGNEVVMEKVRTPSDADG